MCMICYVDAAMKDKIVAYNSEFHKVAKSPFGADDEIGMLNLIDGASRSKILGAADASKVFDLSVDHFVGMPGWFGAGDQPYQIWMTHTPGGEIVDNSMGVSLEANQLVGYSGDSISMYTHCGTHIDTLNHFGYNAEIFNGYTAEKHLGSRAWAKCGAEKHPPIFARGVLLDVAGLHGVPTLPPSHAIGRQDIEDCLARQGTVLHPGDVVLIHTGQMKLWPSLSFVSNTPGLNREGAEYLAKHGAIMIGADNLTLEQTPAVAPLNFFPVHTYLLAEAGVPILEMAYLDELVGEKVYEFAFFGACIKLRGATGAPMRPVAMPPLAIIHPAPAMPAAARRSVAANQQSAVRHDDLAGDVARRCRGQEDGDVGDLLRLAVAAEGNELGRGVEPGLPEGMNLGQGLSRADITRRDAVHPDAVPGEFHREPPDESDDAALGRRIMDMLVPAVGHAHDRRQRDDRALALPAHGRGGGARDPEDAAEIDLQRVCPFLIGEVRQRHLVGDAGIGQDRIERPVGGFDPGHDRVDLRRVADVEGVELGRPALPDDLRGHLTPLGFEDIGDDHAIARAREGVSRGPAYPDPGAGDQHCRSFHAGLLFLWTVRRMASRGRRAAPGCSMI